MLQTGRSIAVFFIEFDTEISAFTTTSNSADDEFRLPDRYNRDERTTTK
jgi:hypothetical protein